MLKRAVAVIAAAIMICISLCSCGSGKKAALTVAGAEISDEIFSYYYDKVLSNPASYSLTEASAQKEFTDKAVGLCVHYVAANTMFEKNGLSLTAAEKTEISQQVNNLWIRYENHYRKIGVSRAALTKIETADAYENKLFLHFYDKAGDAKAESEILMYYYINYTAFRAVCAYFVDESGAPMSTVERAELVATFEKLIDEYASSADFTAAAEKFGYTATDVSLLKNGDDGYPEGFFNSVASLESGSAAVLEYDDCVFAIQKESLEDENNSLYSSYRSECMRELYGNDFSNIFSEQEKAYEVVRNESVLANAVSDVGAVTAAQS